MQQVGMNPVTYTVNNVQQNVKPEQIKIPAQQSEQTASTQGAEALANYNKPLVNNTPQFKVLQPAKPTDVSPDAIQALQGERIYDANGNIHSLIQRTPQTTTTYKFLEKDTVSSITTKDNATNKNIKEELFLWKTDEKGKATNKGNVLIDEYFPNSDKCMRSTYYDENGKLKNCSENEFSDGNYRKCTSEKQDIYSVMEESKAQNYYKCNYYDSNKKLIKTENGDYDRYNIETVEYKDGVVINKTTKTKKPMENTTGRNPESDPSLKPSQPYQLTVNPLQLNGQRLNYSNGSANKIITLANNCETTYTYEPDGALKNITEDYQTYEKNVFYHPDNQMLSEHWKNEEITKDTSNFKDGATSVSIRDKKNNLIKCVDYAPNGKIKEYREAKLDNFETIISMEYDDNGNLIDVRND